MTVRELFGKVLNLPKKQALSRKGISYSPETVARAKSAFRKADIALLRLKTAPSEAPLIEHFSNADLVSA